MSLEKSVTVRLDLARRRLESAEQTGDGDAAVLAKNDIENLEWLIGLLKMVEVDKTGAHGIQ
jgi:hypothetical protein